MCNSRFDAEKGHIPLNVEKNYSDSEIKSSFDKNITRLQYELQKEMSKIRQLESRTNFLQSELQNYRSKKTPKHIVFAEDYNELIELHHIYAEKSQANKIVTNEKMSSDDSYVEDIHNQRFSAYTELSERLERAKQLKYLLRQHEAKKNLMANSTKRGYKTVFKGSKTAPPVYKFEPVRDR
ncbi:unnamed protein product [Schistosoma turkestanicum]|nr:unnamed protein product [Schistosoma turkestanicum]